MRLDELKQPDKEITKSYMNYLYKAAKSGQDDISKSGMPKLNVDGSTKKKAKPLTGDFGERRALRGTPTAGSHQKTKNASLGPIVGSGGAMHTPISPSDAAKALSDISDKMRTGQSLPYSQLKDQSDSYEAVTMRNKRSAPGRAAVWPNGAKWDKDGPYYKMNRVVLSPDGTKKITKSSKAKKPASSSQLVTDPTKRRRFKSRRQAQAERRKLSRGKLPRAKKSYTAGPKPGSKPMTSGKIYNPGTIDENFSKSLNRALGL